jgi:predicted DNA-binding ribbon-helix-helix protein
MNFNPLWKTSLERSAAGKFERKFINENKKLRSVRLTDTAWDVLENIANQNGISRTDVIELWAREKENQQKILLRAIEQFISDKQEEYGLNNRQKGEFNTNTRDWTRFKEFAELARNAPWELLEEPE